MEYFRYALLSMGACLLLSQTILSAVLSSNDNKNLSYVPSVRNKRTEPEHSNCGNWSKWINSNTPTTSVRTDREYMTPAEIEAFCPAAEGGHITQMMCLESQAGLFVGVKHDTDRQFTFRCNNVSEGAVCVLADDHADPCPDVAVKFFCSCSPPPSYLQTPPLPASLTRTRPNPTPPLSIIRTPAPVHAPTFHIETTSKSTSKSVHASPSLFVSRQSPFDAGQSQVHGQSSSISSTALHEGSMASPDSSNSEESEESDEVTDNFTPNLLLYHTVPTASGLLVVIILCSAILIMVCKKNISSVNPIKPMGTGHLF